MTKKKVVEKKKNISVKNDDLVLRVENAGLKAKLGEAERKNIEYEKRLKGLSFVDIPIDLGDPSPQDQEKRRTYVSLVANLHYDVLRPKLMQMISLMHTTLENENNTRDQDQAIKGTIYALREIIRWGDLMTSEDASYRIEPKEEKPEVNKKENEN